MPQVCTTDDRGGTSRMGCERFWPAQSRNVSLQVRNLDEVRHGNVRIRMKRRELFDDNRLDGSDCLRNERGATKGEACVGCSTSRRSRGGGSLVDAMRCYHKALELEDTVMMTLT